jgi:predicted signal transduction protein with EAL and GGDEF domain
MDVTASVGISAYAPGIGFDEILTQPDIALYRAKDEGPNGYCFHSGDLDSEADARATLANDMKEALKRSELELYFQPQVGLSTGRIVGMEVLIRWNQPETGPSSAGSISADCRKNAHQRGAWTVGSRPCLRTDERLAGRRNRAADSRGQSVAQAVAK